MSVGFLPTALAILSLGYLVSRGFIFKIAKNCERWGYVDAPGERKLQKQAVPYGGGFVVLLGWLFWALVITLGHVGGVWAKVWPEHELLPQKLVHSNTAWAVGFGLIAMLGLGCVDDIFTLRPRVKLGFQTIVVAGVLWWGDLGMSFFWDWPSLGFVVSLLWVLLITNAFNLIDNMDGYCSSVALVALAVHVILCELHGHHLVALAALMSMGSLLAFAQQNWPPAKLYLGDAGSLSLGFFMAMLSIASTYYHTGQSLASFLTPILILAIPLFDVGTVMWIRFRLKEPLFKGDRRHFSHRLLALGCSPNQALLVITGISLITGLAAICVNLGDERIALFILVQIMVVLGLVGVLERAGQKRWEQKG